jgi:glycosyltransferase involved in cell wall biosynthesis
MARQLRETLLFSSGKVEVIHNGIPLSQFSRPANFTLRNTLTMATGQPIILTTARLDKQKGHSHLLAAAALVREGLFVLAGNGPERIALEARARQLGVADRVIFLGHRDDIPDLMASCDLFVLPSLNEGLPLSVLEAMAAGKPVIASAIGGMDEIIMSGETGLLVPPADPASLAGAIRMLLSDSVFAQRLATAGKAYVHRKFSAETMVRRVAQIYDELLSCYETL